LSKRAIFRFSAPLWGLGATYALHLRLIGKRVVDFLLVINTKLCPISHRFQVIVGYWSNLHCRQRGYPSLTTSFGVNPYTQDHEIWPQQTRNIALSCGAKSVSIHWTV